jgi:hypothetical protein
MEHFNEMGVVVVMEDGAPIHWSKIAKEFHTQNSMDTLLFLP